MIRTRRPASGRFLTILLPLFFACLGLISCAKKNVDTVDDTWRMVPPTLEMKAADGNAISIKSSEFASKTARESVAINESASLKFAAADHGLELNIKSRCSAADETEREFSETMTTTGAISMISFLHPMLLAPSSLRKEWACDIRLRVINNLGSWQEFGFKGLKLVFSNNVERLMNAPLTIEGEKLTIRGPSLRRLICSSWWTDPSDLELGEMMRVNRVNGVDTRTSDRQPLCTIVEVAPKIAIVGFVRGRFANPQITWSLTSLLPKAELFDLFRRHLLQWNFRNDESTAQVIYVSTVGLKLRLSSLMASIDVNSVPHPTWSRPTLTSGNFTFLGGAESRQTPDGIYFRLPPGGTAQLQIFSGRPLQSYANFAHHAGARLLLMTTEVPMVLATITSPETVPHLPTADSAVLATLPRDEIREKQDTLLSSLVLQPDDATGMLLPSAMTYVEAMRLGPVGQSPMCVEGTPAGLKPPAE